MSCMMYSSVEASAVKNPMIVDPAVRCQEYDLQGNPNSVHDRVLLVRAPSTAGKWSHEQKSYYFEGVRIDPNFLVGAAHFLTLRLTNDFVMLLPILLVEIQTTSR